MKKKFIKTLSIIIVFPIIISLITVSLSSCYQKDSSKSKLSPPSIIQEEFIKKLDEIAKNIHFEYEVFDNDNQQMIQIDKIKIIGDLQETKLTIIKTFIDQKTKNFFVEYDLNLSNKTKKYKQILKINKKQNVIQAKYVEDKLYSKYHATHNYRPFALNQLLTQQQNIKNVNDLSIMTIKKNNHQYLDYFNFIGNENNFYQHPFIQKTLLTKQNQTTDSRANFRFEKIEINKENQTATINFSHDSDSQTTEKILNAINKRILVKNYDWTNPFSEIITYEKVNNNQLRFSLKTLPKSLKKFIITHIQYDDIVESLGNDLKNSFLYNQFEKEYTLQKLDFYQYQNEIYGSAFFNFDHDALEIYKNKTFLFEFTLDENYSDARKEKSLFAKYTPPIKFVRVPFKSLWKFKIPHLYNGFLYKLNKISIHDTNSMAPFGFIKTNNINIKPSFIINLIYDDRKIIDLYHVNNQNFSTKYQTLRNMNLTLNDLYNLWQSNQSQLYLDYSLRNFISLVQYENSYQFYHTKANENFYDFKAKKTNFKLVYNNEIKNLHKIALEENTDDLIFKKNTEGCFNLKKSLTKINNLNLINEKYLMFNITFGLDPNLIKETNLWDDIMLRSQISLSIPYTTLRDKKTIEDAEFVLNYAIGNKEYEHELYKKIKQSFRFKVTYINDELIIEIIPKNNVHIFDNIWEHNSSTNSSYFLTKANINIYYLNDTAIDINENNKLNNQYATRIYKDNEEKFSAIKNARNRVMSLSLIQDGTWNVLGKVKPNDDNDYRYYLISCAHVLNSTQAFKSINKTGNKNLFETGNSCNGDFDPLVPQIVNESEVINDKKVPYYNATEKNGKLEANKNQFQFLNFPKKINIESIINFNHQAKNKISPHVNSLGHFNSNSSLDFSLITVDLKPIFEKYGKLEESIDFKNLTKEQKAVIKHIINFKNLKPLKLSEQTKYFSNGQHVNWYLATFPRTETINNFNAGKLPRYREYIINKYDKIQENITTINNYSSTVGTTKISGKYLDIGSGSSGSVIYDESGNLIGMVSFGAHANGKFTAGGLIVFDSLISGFFGDKNNLANRTSLIQQIKQLAYLYPEKYEDIYK
ncbi:hypothetical protein [Ureaplasma urealyticum]|uniref:hypothetical protein n=1 Tax=Ureaplasma urealyticum TaxID=2130 RepID=UPI002906C447|nr:hypothetical protein [Ureaplasma urealyticum]MDU3864974.1 hypothetical protein [Ureaplasma urealyticum]